MYHITTHFGCFFPCSRLATTPPEPAPAPTPIRPTVSTLPLSARKAHTYLTNYTVTQDLINRTPSPRMIQARAIHENMLKQPLTIRSLFSKPLDECLFILRELTPNAADLDQLATRNCNIKELVNRLLREEEEASKLADNSPESATTSLISVRKLAHELRAPLQEIQSKIEIYKMSSPEERESFEGFIAGLQSCYKHVQLLVNDLPILPIDAKMQLTLQTETFTLSKLRDRVAHLTRDSARQKEITFDFRFPGLKNQSGSEQEFHGDLGKLIQVILNFANNAIKYGTQKGTVIISAKVEKEVGNSNVLFEFKIEDNGPGISEEMQKRLFGAFARGEHPKEAVASSGVGLFLTKQFVELMNPQSRGQGKRPTIGVQSNLGKGSLFWFTAVLKAVPSSIQAMSASPPPEPKEKFDKRDLRLLCADDAPTILKLMGKIFSAAGCTAPEHRPTVINGKEAVKICEYQKFDVVFLDDYMPVMTGTEAAKAIYREAKEANKTAPNIVMLTGNSTQEIHNKLTNSAENLVPCIIETGKNPIDEIQKHIVKFGPGPKIVILTKPVGYSTIVQTVNALTSDD